MSFGQNVLAKHESQLFLFADDFVGIGKHFVDVMPGILYGITDDLSLFINAPIAANYKQDNQHSAGFEDAFYTKKTPSYIDQATIVANVTLPTAALRARIF